jgi:monoamine oxidase
MMLGFEVILFMKRMRFGGRVLSAKKLSAIIPSLLVEKD